MFESELGLATVIGAWILYELYGRTLLEYSGYIRMVGGIAIICYLYYQTPEQFQDSLELAKQLMTAKDNDTKVKRNVSGLAKKKVAASQQWKCGHCGSTLDETYEVDHRIALYKGGTNEMDNLVALCPHCHRKKTVEERLA